MARNDTHSATKQPRLPLLGVAGALLLALPSAGLAVVGLSGDTFGASAGFDVFTPASVDPDLAARVATKARERGIRFTPVGARAVDSERTVTVAVRVDGDTARAISIRPSVQGQPGLASGIAGIQASRFNLGTARGYQSFARSPATSAPVTGAVSGRTTLPGGLENIQMPDLAEFEPSRPTREERPSRLQPRMSLEDETIVGRSPNTLDALGSQTVDVGGSFRLSPNLDVTAGVRLSQERDRLTPLTDSVQDSQAVYVGTQIRF